jgi:hypothetical protein
MNVRFLGVKLKSTFNALETKESNALYWIEETQELYKGATLYGTGALATAKVAGLLSPEDKAKLDALVASGGGLSNLTAIDGTISIFDTADNGKAIGVNIAPIDGNQLVAVDGGLFVPTVVVPEYSIEKQSIAEEGFAATYKLKKTVGEDISYVGDSINIARDLVLKTATLETVTEDGVPYAEAKVGDPYIKMEFNDANTSALYIPVKGLVDTYIAGDGISIENGVVSVKLADVTHGLQFVDGSLSFALATRTVDGAMSKEDKRIVDSLPYAYVARKYDISDTPIGTLVNYGEKEIRIMCPADAEFKKQAVGVGGDANTYYITFNTYAPNDKAVGYIEHLGGQVDNEILTKFSTDEYGRRYQSTWLGVAKFDEATSSWNYYGANSNERNMIGWDYRIDWYNSDNVRIATDAIRINLSNEDCHDFIRPYYGPDNDISTEVTELQNTAAELQESYSWGEL